MTSNLSRFQVIGLHGAINMDVRLEDNRLVLVGENGTGKSTLANLIYCFLTRQWDRLREFRFSRLQAHFGEQELVLTPEHLEQHLVARRQLHAFMQVSRHYPARVTGEAIDRLMELTLESPDDESTVTRLASELRLPPRVARAMLDDYIKTTKAKPTHIQTLDRLLSRLVSGQFLYLPTYRRIEQDLTSIFRGIDIDSELRKFRERLARRSGATFLELVEFGMEDVEQTITRRMAQIKENVRNGLDNLTGTYLRDVIRGVHTKVDVQSLEKIDAAALDAVFERIDEATLPTSDKALLKEKVAAISTTHAIEEQDKVIAHFLSKLIDLYTEQQANEKNVRDFVTLCNQYLSGKEIVYDNVKYTIFISRPGSPEAGTLEMRGLSSGEKQIVSLFSHIYLSGEKNFFVIIDEPELSLSVPWQRRFLPDILGTGMCNGLVAVTHSPFVWENKLEAYVKPLAEFTSPYTG